MNIIILTNINLIQVELTDSINISLVKKIKYLINYNY